MNPAYLASSTQYRWRTSVQQPPSTSTAYTTYNEAPTAPQGVISQAQETLRDNTQSLRPAMRRKPFVELHSNVCDRFGRENSPSPRRTAALQTIRRYERERNETLTLQTSTRSEIQSLSQPMEDLTLRLGLSSAARRKSVAPERKTAAIILKERLSAVKEDQGSKTNNPNTNRQDDRRRTIYVPDDTTVLTIHPGASLAGKPLRRTSLAPREPQEARRRSKVMVPPKLSDLEETATLYLNQEEPTIQVRVDQSETTTSLSGGKNFGKKPRRRSLAVGVGPGPSKTGRYAPLATVAESSPQDRQGQQPVAMNDFSSRTALSSMSINRRTNSEMPIQDKSKKDMRSDPIQDILARRHARIGSVDHISATPPESKPVKRSNSVKLPGNFQDKESKNSALVRSHNRFQSDFKPTFEIFQDDLACPELYEDNWLENQEIALAQLLNTFFEAHDPMLSDSKPSRDSLRSNFIRIYNDTEMVHLVKRLQASLIYGSLMVPQDVLSKSIRLKDDIGQRQKFLNFFLDTYNHDLLQAAAEAIVGRQLGSSERLSASNDMPGSGNRRNLETFLDSFFVQHQDVTIINKPGNSTITTFVRDKTDQIGSLVWAWRRTVIRSLMLILILDNAKVNGIQERLFQPSSQLKSSEAVVKSISSLLLPSYGDVMRPLRHLKYDVSVFQTALEEIDYNVENIATDLRDGVRLARIVEIILTQTRHSNTITSELTSQIKYPCTSRSQRLHNVMIVLGGLTGLRGIPEKLFREVTAIDIIDGHREKTLSLLWALLGQYGVDYLVDKEMLLKDIEFFKFTLAQRGNAQKDNDVSSQASLTESWGLLYEWARLICALRNIQVSNLTTSFADGTAFEAVIKTYLPYFPVKTKQTRPSLGATLRAIGCSSAFSALLSAPRDIIPTKDFTLTSLAYLAARMLPAAKVDRAARVIQRAYRHRLKRFGVTKRVALMRLAAHCAVVVNAREKVVGAATVLQRSWRRVLDCRRKKLDDKVSTFQAVARGWMVRNRNRTSQAHKGRAGW